MKNRKQTSNSEPSSTVKQIRYWHIAPGVQGEHWTEQRDHRCIAVGWVGTKDLELIKDKQDLKKEFQKKGYGNRQVEQLWKFYKEVNVGDKVIANSGKKIFGLGTVKGDYKFDDSLEFQHSRPVRWEVKFWAPLSMSDIKLPPKLERKLSHRSSGTIRELTKQEWEKLEDEIDKANSPFEGFTNFEGICHAPENEQETIILFSKISLSLKKPMKIENVSTLFPDAWVRVKKRNTWDTYAAEFEFTSSGFEKHKAQYLGAGRYKQKKCDYIICWENDWKTKPHWVKKNLDIIELKKEMKELL